MEILVNHRDKRHPGYLILDRMIKYNLTISLLSKATKISRKKISAIIYNQSHISFDMIAKISHVLDLDPYVLCYLQFYYDLEKNKHILTKDTRELKVMLNLQK